MSNNLITTVASGLLISILINIFLSIIFELKNNNSDTPIKQAKMGLLRFVITFVAFVLVVFFPVSTGLTLIELLHGVVGDLSVTTLLVLLLVIRNNLFNHQISIGEFEAPVMRYNIVPNRAFAFILVVLGWILYSSYLGFISFDIYDMGYFPSPLFMLVLGIIELFLWLSARDYALLWLVALLGFYFKCETSHNLWDYLFDPILWLICLVRLFRF